MVVFLPSRTTSSLMVVPGRFSSYLDLKLARVGHLLTIECGDHVADFQASLRRR